MRTSILALNIARNVADAATGSAVIVTDKPVETLGDTAKPRAAKSNIAVKPRTPKLSGKAVAKPEAKPSKAAKPSKPAADDIPRYENKRYAGPSPVFRNHDRKLSPIVLNRVPGSFTDRDVAFIRDLHDQHGGRNFKRANCDAGNLSRAIGHGLVKHVSGALDQRDCLFALTAAGIKRAKPVSAPKA